MNKTITSVQLQRLNDGDSKALNDLLKLHLPWLQEKVHFKIGPVVRQLGDTCDFINDAFIDFLRWGPRIHISDENHFRKLLLRIVKNDIIDQSRKIKRMPRPKQLPSDTVLQLDPGCKVDKTPSQEAVRHEEEEFRRLGTMLLKPEYHEIIMLHTYERLRYTEIAEQLDITQEAARSRHNRAVDRLGELIHLLRSGKVDQI